MRQRLRTQDGANAVEFALVLPMLLILIFGAITAGLSLNTRQQMDHAVREGARFASTLPFGTADPCGGGGSWWECVRNHVEGTSVGFVNTADGGICVSYIDPAATPSTVTERWGTLGSGQDNTPCFPETPPLTSVRVQVLSRMPGSLDGVFFGWGFDMESKAVSMHEES